MGWRVAGNRYTWGRMAETSLTEGPGGAQHRRSAPAELPLPLSARQRELAARLVLVAADLAVMLVVCRG